MDKPLIDSSLFLRAAWARKAYSLVQAPVEWILGMARVNAMYRRVGGRGLGPAEFCQAGLEDFGVRWSVNDEGMAALAAVRGPCLVVANHPLGGREAMALQCLLGRARADYRILSNYVIGGVPEVSPSLILVNPYETRASLDTNQKPLRETLKWLRQGGLLGVFPAGEVSYWQPAEGRVADRPWADQVLRLALKAEATVVPLHFGGRNSAYFNALARLRPDWKGFLLVQQLVAGPSTHVQATLGRPILAGELPFADEPPRLAAWLREKVYELDPERGNPPLSRNP